MREKAKRYTRHLIANGNRTNFWYSPWSEAGILHELTPSAIKYLTGIRETTLVKEYIENNQWKPAPNSNILVTELWKKVTQTVIDTYEDEDEVVWTPSPNGRFTIRSAYAVFRKRYHKVEWAQTIWNPSTTPKHAFITWLAVRERLTTQDKLVKWGLAQKSVCALCTDNLNRNQLLRTGSCYGMINYFKVQWQSNTFPPICNEGHYNQVANSGVVGQNSSACIPQETHWHLWGTGVEEFKQDFRNMSPVV
ncbi:RNA-directed DNA polymerase (reverse transcriptase)-related family protein [Thalictrum thalictroides]|uniref:RNA-directed DNA polymerase (Reverse transcriptase)-related family protein n=1 Tax=Thalictrum thalictroides TaxID=46969 RepID=A0A7J6WNH7_THATH|nr:RNA-directed DNA polymerase (reverse transcriptase)-related family protein [Thalictrum thalictroides]